jgi:hypothetical protein
MDLDSLLSLLAFRHRIREPDSAEGRMRVEAIVGRQIDPVEFAAAVTRLLTGGVIHDPVCLPAGALQCDWRLELTQEGFEVVQAMQRERGMSADALIAALVSP